MTEYTSNRLLRFPLLGVLLLCATMLPGCAAQETTRTGFLSHYQAMERDDKNKDSLVYKSPPSNDPYPLHDRRGRLYTRSKKR